MQFNIVFLAMAALAAAPSMAAPVKEHAFGSSNSSPADMIEGISEEGE